MQSAAHAQSPTTEPPPDELVMAWKWERWGTMEESGGLRDQPLGLVDSVTGAVNVYDAWRAFSSSGNNIVDWAAKSPGQMKIVAMVQRMRDGTV